MNPWVGCTKVGPGCDHCYAERDNKRHKWVSETGVDGQRRGVWGTGAPRRRTKTWGDPIRWNREAGFTGARPRVFCASLADVFDNEVPQEWRDDLWDLIARCYNLRWMLLTKRIGNATKMLPADWGHEWSRRYRHVGLMATIVNQEEWDRDFGKLMAVPAAWHGVSAEPLLGRIDIGDARPDWIITGGESGPHFRPLDMDAVRWMQAQCARNGIAYHHKQNGGITGKARGCLIDGAEYKAFPEALAV